MSEFQDIPEIIDPKFGIVVKLTKSIANLGCCRCPQAFENHIDVQDYTWQWKRLERRFRSHRTSAHHREDI